MDGRGKWVKKRKSKGSKLIPSRIECVGFMKYLGFKIRMRHCVQEADTNGQIFSYLH